MIAANGSHVDEILRYMLIPNEDEVALLEREYAGAIRIGPSGRYGCRLLVKGNIIEFRLKMLPDGSEDFFLTKNGDPFNPFELGVLLRIVRHRAAEIMIAVRTGHMEYNRRRYDRKGKNETPQRAGT